MDHKTQADSPRESTSAGCSSMHTMQIRMLKDDVSPVKRKLAEACSQVNKIGFNVWLHIYDLGPLSKWTLNSWSSKQSGLGAFHCGVEVLGVEWSFQAMSDCESEDMTGVMCHTPKSHPRHVYRESVWLGDSPLCANEICNVLARLERDWPARSYHFLRHNCTDFAEALSSALDVPTQFPSWAHGIAKSLLGADKENKENIDAAESWWLPNALAAACCSHSCVSGDSSDGHAKVGKPHGCGAMIIMPGCEELFLPPRTMLQAVSPNSKYPRQ